MSLFDRSVATQSRPAPEFYTWTFPGAPVRVLLNLNVVEQLGREVRRAFESVPAHSVEIGGLLLGTAGFASSPVVEIKHFEPFLSEYRTDHKFILSDADSRKLENLLTGHAAYLKDGLSVVGFYRSHIGEGLALRPQEVALAEKYFNDPAKVFLLVKTVDDGFSTAGFFFWDGGRIESQFSYLEFPFEPRLLSGAAVPERAPEADAEHRQSAPEGLGLPELPSLEDLALEASAPRRPSWLSRLLFAVGMMVVGAAGFGIYMQWSAPPAAPKSASHSPALALEIERRGADLRVSWNAHSFAVARAIEGVLVIRDGEMQEQQLRLEADQLRHGSIFYTPANPAVQFRLEVTDQDNVKTSETVLALTAARLDSAPGVPPGGTVPAVQQTPGRKPPSSGAGSRQTAPSSTAGNHDFGEPVRIASVAPPSPGSSAGVPESSQPEPAAPQSHESYTPPQAIREVQPKLPASAGAEVTSPVEVQIRVHIDDKGAVVKAEPVPGTQPVSSSLVDPARAAALRWRFEPAWQGNRPVASEVVLKFQYHPAAP